MKIDRKKFFITASTSFLGIAFLKNIPFSLLGRKDKSGNVKMKVKINPSAVSRSSKEDHHA